MVGFLEGFSLYHFRSRSWKININMHVISVENNLFIRSCFWGKDRKFFSNLAISSKPCGRLCGAQGHSDEFH